MNKSEKQAVNMMINKLDGASLAVFKNRELIEKYTDFEELNLTMEKMDELSGYLRDLHEEYGYGADDDE